MDRKVALVRKLDFWSFGHDFLELDCLELDCLELDFLELDFLAHDFCMVAHFPVNVHDGSECA